MIGFAPSRREALKAKLDLTLARAISEGSKGLLTLMFLAWWLPLTLLGLLPWWAQAPLWLGLLAFRFAVDAPMRVTLQQQTEPTHVPPHALN